jgi:hypothetical protein
MELQFEFVIGFLKLFWWKGNSQGFPTSHHRQDSDIFYKSYDVSLFFLSNEGIPSNLLKTAKFC